MRYYNSISSSASSELLLALLHFFKSDSQPMLQKFSNSREIAADVAELKYNILDSSITAKILQLLFSK